MPNFEVKWQAFGTIVVAADNEDDAISEAQDWISDELLGFDWDGLDVTDPVPASSWQTPVNDED